MTFFLYKGSNGSKNTVTSATIVCRILILIVVLYSNFLQFNYRAMALQQVSLESIRQTVSINMRLAETVPTNSILINTHENLPSINRRSIMAWSVATVASTIPAFVPKNCNAAIDVSGLRPAEMNSKENPVIFNQIKSYDGSERTRIQEIQKMKTTTTTTSSSSSSSSTDPGLMTTMNDNNSNSDEAVGIATYAYRYSTAFGPRITKVGNYGEKVRCDDQLLLVKNSNSRDKTGILSISFEFPSDWLQLDKILGGIQYVDQRNGDKLYVLKVNLPTGSNILDVPKQFFGDAIFHPQGTIIRSGISVDEYKVKNSKVISDGSVSIPHRRLLIKYTTVTPNGLRTERRGLVDVYEIDSVAYMMITSSNAVKFEANGRERETVEAIVDSFRIEKVV